MTRILLLLRTFAEIFAISLFSYGMGVLISFSYTNLIIVDWLEYLRAQSLSILTLFVTSSLLYVFFNTLMDQTKVLYHSVTLYLISGITMTSTFIDQYNQLDPPVYERRGWIQFESDQKEGPPSSPALSFFSTFPVLFKGEDSWSDTPIPQDMLLQVRSNAVSKLLRSGKPVEVYILKTSRKQILIDPFPDDRSSNLQQVRRKKSESKMEP